MKNSITFFIITVILISCNPEKSLLDYSQEKADQFVLKYADQFLLDEELLRYSYNPRAQFTNIQDSTNNYRIYPNESEIRLICFSDSCELKEPFNICPLILHKGTYTLKQDSIISELSHDSFTVKAHYFELSPAVYFNGLKKRLDKFGIFAYFKSKDKSFIKVYLSVQYYLIHTKKVQKDIKNDKIIKSYKDNWYFVKMEREMDLG